MNRKISLNMKQLKTIAMILMLIDHIAYVMIERGTGLGGDFYMLNRIMRSIGRTAFPIFCFTIVEGFQKTSNLKAYLKRLILFAFVSEIPFDLAFRGSLFSMQLQNVFWTLAFGLGALMLYENYWIPQWKRMLGLFACFTLPMLYHTDYSVYGVATIFAMYYFRNEPIKACMAGYIILILQNPIEAWAVFGFLLILMYNGQRGCGGKWFTYWFYPGHLLLLVLVKPYGMEILSRLISNSTLV